MGISIRVASPKLVMEEAPESYKNVTDVVDTCHAAGISKKCIKLRPIAVIKGWLWCLFIVLGQYGRYPVMSQKHKYLPPFLVFKD